MPSSNNQYKRIWRQGLFCLALILALIGCTAPGSRSDRDSGAVDGFQQALADIRAGRDDEAIARLEAITARRPDLVGAQVNLAAAYARTGRPAQAWTRLTEAARHAPYDPAVLTEMGVVKRMQGEFEAALEYYQRAISADETYAPAHRNIGILLDLYLQRPQDALRHYRRYRDLSEANREMVDSWITDLERRLTAP